MGGIHVLLGRTTYDAFEPAWSNPTVDDDPGAPPHLCLFPTTRGGGPRLIYLNLRPLG